MARGSAQSSFHVVLLAGGSGTRFWPLSRSGRPKQFLALAGRRPLLEETWRRVRGLAPPERIWVVAPAALARDVRGLLPELRQGRLVIEPTPRDTAPAVGLACATVARQDPDAVVGIFPTDHVVRERKEFLAAVKVAARAARESTRAVRPTRPHAPRAADCLHRPPVSSPARCCPGWCSHGRWNTPTGHPIPAGRSPLRLRPRLRPIAQTVQGG